MFIVISPAKKLDFDNRAPVDAYTLPRLLQHSSTLVQNLKKMNFTELKQLFKLSDNLTALNQQRFANWQSEVDLKTGKQALFAFKGDVYVGLNADNLTQPQIDRAQQKLRILSGLYGLLRPLDLMMAYRLEMGTRLGDAAQNYQNLYQFWGAQIAQLLAEDMRQAGDNVLVNLASAEYFKAIGSHIGKLGIQVVDVEFREQSAGADKIIGIYAKKARGLMCRYILEQENCQLADLKQFDWQGYQFNPSKSDDNCLVFCRAH